MKNILYINHIQEIGGVETFIYELAYKYQDWDITVVYNSGNQKQINRLKQIVRTIQYVGQKIECEKAFFNYDISIIDNVEAKEYIEIIHADYITQKIQPHLHSKITKYLGVSQRACEAFTELTGIECELMRNPLTIKEEDSKRVLFLISATRLSPVKGKDRMIKLVNELTNKNIPFLWLIFTDDIDAINNPNVVYMKPRLDIRPYIASIKGKGYGVQVSNSEGDCYFTRECEALGVPVLVTPCPSFIEQGIIEGVNGYYLPFDMKGIDIDKIYNNIPEYEPWIMEDKWNEILAKGENTYKEELKMRYLVRALDTRKMYNKVITDTDVKRERQPGEEWEVNEERLNQLLGNNANKRVMVEVVKKLDEEIETAVKEPEVETAKKTTTKKKATKKTK